MLLDDLGAQTWLVGVSLSLFTVPMIVLAPTAGRLTQKIGHSAIVGKSITLAAVCTALYGWIDLLWPVLLISLVSRGGRFLHAASKPGCYRHG